MKKDAKDSIVLVAQKMFKRFGFRKTTMDEIAVAARKGKSSLYYYFKSKEEVFEAVVEKEATTLRTDIITNIGKCNSAMEKLRVYIFVRMDGFRNWGNFYEALKDEYLSNYEFIEKIRIKYDRSETETITQIINEGIENKEFKDLNSALTAKIIVTAMKGLEIPLLTASDKKANFKKEINEMLEVLFHGICI
ncbi:MAG TPA: TetR/AcrR family transcriptional regulator [Draconibacterium sp.]|nr:TetR/AcrR family transcriptional regulator [Draconibacterium sp.]